MTAFGFSITGVIVTGPGVPDAEIRLTDGLNVVSGPSDTGKTFIAQCIDFVLGARTLPKQIPEAAAYDTVCLGLRIRSSGEEVSLQRSLRGGQILLKAQGHSDRVLAPAHAASNPNTVSRYLLDLSGLQGKTVRTNQRGTTRELSFRDIARLVIVDEETVLSETSPVLSGQYVTKTAETSVFRLLLTGVDDSSVVEVTDQRIVRTQQEAKIEIIEELRRRAEEQIVERGIVGTVDELRGELARLETLFNQAAETLAAEQGALSALETRRNSSWGTTRRIDSRLSVLSELQERFTLLAQQYASDLRRLESISEAGTRLAQLREERCPVCGAPAEHHDVEHQNRDASPAQVSHACTAEAAKIRTLLEDLEGTRRSNADEMQTLRQQRAAAESELSEAVSAIQDTLKPRVQQALTAFRESQARRDYLRSSIELHERRASFEEMVAALEAAGGTRAEGLPSAAVRSSEAEVFSQEVENVLREWRFPDLGRVVFSETTQDLVISGRDRASHGKGVRAITHAAFNLALLNYCVGRTLPHPLFVTIDSPLVVYREPDAGEGQFSGEVKKAFYESLARYEGRQVLILENEDPPHTLDTSANIIRFTGSNEGRRGFIP